MASSASSSGGAGFFTLLSVAFIVLKLTGFIDWSWWWVTAPIWGSILLWIIVVGLVIYFNR
jgi:uncharacterized protein (DUF983 family)